MPSRSSLIAQQVSVTASSHRDDLEFINKMVDKTAIERLKHGAVTPFKRLSYTEAIEILVADIGAKKVKFEFKVCHCFAPIHGVHKCVGWQHV